MITEKRIINLDDVFRLISDQNYDTVIQRNRSSFLYRGLSNQNYQLTTTLQRNCKEKKDELEKCILRNFMKYAEILDNRLNNSIWRQMTVGQHHGLPTRLLDWTYSPLIALHFALSETDLSKIEEYDSVIWKIDIEEINSLLPKIYQNTLFSNSAYLFTIDMLEKVVSSLDDYDKDMSNNAMVLLEPPSIDDRIINQYSYFSIIPKEMIDIEKFLNDNTTKTVKYVIDRKLKWRIRDFLDQMNMNERIIYPGLDGLSTWLKRHYFVK